ncbi:hypothetical protein A6E15_19455 [Natrinema saccharevitans]|uniref:Uncharacterized protein n=1 Tax=Natrinema saccharevitans TaxID=301967 RepID=A0A1S8AR22_9EURY|nr:hypothetical protein [Natrinema saccharevitans]OLZ39056.1 hypothetical protein A6E15_19010 [Natrinema saccharevitans]OLZ39142.1 hypothetical protein A6E15_19455 [Natrinema saccharevitans]
MTETLECRERAMLRGIPVGVGQTALCDGCGRTLRPNDRVEILVDVEGTVIDFATTRGPCCARGELPSETTRDCWLVSGRLATSHDHKMRSELVLSGASVIGRTD